MVTFSSKQAFGFDSFSRADRSYYSNVVWREHDPYLFRDQAHRAPYDRTGLNPEENELFDIAERRLPVPNIDKKIRSAISRTNVFKILGYIPVIGSGIGIARLRNGLKTPSEDFPNKRTHVIRAVFEMASCGWMLIVVDISLTIKRNKEAREEST